MSPVSAVQNSAVIKYCAGQSYIRQVRQIPKILKNRLRKIGETERRKKQNVCHHRPKLAIFFLSKTFFNLQKCVSCDGTDTQTITHTDQHDNSMTDPAQRAKLVKSTGIVLCLMLL